MGGTRRLPPPRRRYGATWPAADVAIDVLSYCVRLISNVYGEYRRAYRRTWTPPTGGGGEKTGAPSGAPVRTGVPAILALTDYSKTGAPTGAPGRRTELRRGRKTGTPTGVPVYFHAAPRTPPTGGGEGAREPTPQP